MFNVETAGWHVIISVLLIIFSFYFTLTFIENLHKGEDERVTKQSKLAAIICFGIALVIPFLIALITK
ncbi:hypothetical protein ACFSUM_15510 [Virgibacillus siamensis]|uniref:hypothetical protein n=1 Tax=Virgibacillus siamensis TaxID=480071 RepID=UPI0036274DF6